MDENKTDLQVETGSNESGKSWKVPQEAYQKLVDGLINLYLGDLQTVSSSLAELIRNQSILIETMQQENSKFYECNTAYNLPEVFLKIKTYQAKLHNIKKDMAFLHDKSQKLKQRAVRLQQVKEKEAAQRNLQKKQEQEREFHLIAKTAVKPEYPKM